MVKDKCHLIEEYEANPFTMMIMPIKYESNTYSKIVEFEDELISPLKPIDIIKKSCEYFGSSFEGRREGTRQLIDITHKAPITIDPTNSIYFFPTTSPSRLQCIWISHEHVLSHKRAGTGSTLVTFRNKQIYTLPISYASFGNQLQRAALLQTKLMQRLEETERRFQYLWWSARLMKVSPKGSLYEQDAHFRRNPFE